MSFTNLRKGCPVCGGIRKDCRQNNENQVIHCRHADANPVDYKFLKLDKLGFGMWLESAIVDEQDEQRREEWKLEQTRQREARIAAEQQRLIAGLTEKERDREFRNLTGQLSLSPKHYEDLLRRGLTDKQIKQGMFASVKKWQKLSSPVSHLLPGVNIDGRSLNIGQSGYLCPVWRDGLIVGCQVRLDNADDGKYRWLTSANKRRPNGQTSHLKNGELPITLVKADGDQDLRFAEGVLKPYVANQRLGKNFIGAAGGQFANSPEQVADAIAQLNPERLILCPDKGAVNNQNVLRCYQALHELVSGLGYELLIEWWGQFEKTAADIDELEPETQTQIISYQEFLKFSTVQPTPTHPTAKLLSKQEWWERYGLPNELKTLTAFIQKHYNRAAYKCFRRTGSLPVSPQPNPQIGFLPNSDTTAIVKWEPPLKLYTPPIQYVSNQLPTYSEWVELGCPKVMFKPGDRINLIGESLKKGYLYVKDSSAPAQGKSHDSGEIDFELLGIEIDPTLAKQPRIFRIDPNYRNPSTATVEQRFQPLVARHEGLDYDPNRKTPMGFHHLVKHQPSPDKPSPDIAPPCDLWESFREMANKDRVVFGGAESPLCQVCPKFSNCGYLKGRAETLNSQQYISADINGMSNPSHRDIGIIEEAGTTLKNTKKISVSLNEIEATIGRLAVNSTDERIYGALIPILDTVHKFITGFDIENKRHGASHSEVAAELPKRQLLESLIWDLFSDDWLNTQNDVWGNPVWKYQFTKKENGDIEEEKAILDFIQWIVPSLQELALECDRLLRTNLESILSGQQSPEEKAALIRTVVIFNWVSPLLKVLSGNRRYSLQIKGNRLQITQPFYRHQNIVKGFGFALFLDATLTVSDLKQKLNLTEPILEIQQTAPDNSNLTINVVNGIGHCGRQREIKQKVNGQYKKVESEYSLKNRIRHAVLEIANAEGRRLHHHRQSPSIAVIDHKAFEKEYDDLIKHQIINLFGYWYRDTRGTNRFLNTEVMINVGKPTPNLGDLAAQWQTMTGEIVNPTNLTSEYGAWVKRQAIAEIIQDIGRLRAHIRPHQQLASWHLCNLDNAEIAVIKRAYPGATVNVIDAYDLCPEAAIKGVQTQRGIIEAVWQGVEAGVQRTTTEIGKAVGVSRSRVSHVVNDLISGGLKHFYRVCEILYKALNSKTHTLEALNLTDEERWVAREFLAAVVVDLEAGTVSASEVLTDVANLAYHYGETTFERMLAATPLKTLLRLCSAVVACLPGDVLDRLAGELEDRLIFVARNSSFSFNP